MLKKREIMNKGIKYFMVLCLLFVSQALNLKAEDKSQDFLDGLKVEASVVDTPLGPQLQYSDPYALQAPSLRARNAFPSNFDLRGKDSGYEKGVITSVKNQGVTGACWSFAAMASIESDLLKQGIGSVEDLNLSERHLAWFAFNHGDTSEDASLYAGNDYFINNMTWEIYSSTIDPYIAEEIKALLDQYGVDKDEFAKYQNGGQHLTAPATLFRNYGIATEKEEELQFKTVYDDYGEPYIGLVGAVSDDKKTRSDYLLTNFIELSPIQIKGEYQPSGTDEIKQALMNGNAVEISYYGIANWFDNEYFNAKNYAQYIDEYEEANHIVTIVGWDDDYSSTNFNEGHRPADNGAWIVKNSWGSDWGNNGYFYLSYYDKTMKNAVYFEATNKKNYDNLYQYDGVGIGNYTFVTKEFGSVANVFTTRNDELLNEVCIYLPYANADVTAKVYTDWTGDNIFSGTVRSEITKYYPNAGQYTLALDQAVVLPKGKKYAVELIEKIKGEEKYIRAVESDAKNNYVSLDVRPEQTYLRNETDLIDVSEMPQDSFILGNALIKAMTKTITMPSTIETTYSPTKTLKDYTEELNKNSSEKNWSWKDENIIPSVDVKEYTAVYTDKETGKTDEMNVTVSVAPAIPVIEEASATSITYGDALSKASITGKASVDNTTVEGTFTWKDDTEVLSAKTKEASIIFTPKDTTNCQTIEGKANIEIGKKEITIKIKDETIVYGQELPSFGYDITKGSLVGKDTLDVTLSTNAKKDSKAGSYDITGNVNSDDYQVIVKKGNLTIVPIELEVNVDASIPSSFVNGVVINGNIKSINGTQPQVVINKAKIDFAKILASNEKILQAFDIVIKDGTYTGALQITLPVSSNVKTVKVVHYLNKGEVDQNGNIVKEDGYDVYENVKVVNGKIQIETYSLSPFAIITEEKETIIPDKEEAITPNQNQNKEESIDKKTDKNTDTSDTTNVLGWVLMLGVSSVGLWYACRKRKI